MIKELAQYIEDNTSLVVNTSLFIGDFPAETGDAVQIVAVASPSPHIDVDTEYQHIELWSRYSSSSEGYDILRQLYELFHQAHHYEMGQTSVWLSEAMGQIDDLGRDSQNRKLWMVGIKFTYHPLNNVS